MSNPEGGFYLADLIELLQYAGGNILVLLFLDLWALKFLKEALSLPWLALSQPFGLGVERWHRLFGRKQEDRALRPPVPLSHRLNLPEPPFSGQFLLLPQVQRGRIVAEARVELATSTLSGWRDTASLLRRFRSRHPPQALPHRRLAQAVAVAHIRARVQNAPGPIPGTLGVTLALAEVSRAALLAAVRAKSLHP